MDQMSLDSLKVPRYSLCLVLSESVVEILNQFMGYVPEVRNGMQGFQVSAKGTIVSSANLDAFIITLVSCIADDGRDSVGGQHQKCIMMPTPTHFRWIADSSLAKRQYVRILGVDIPEEQFNLCSHRGSYIL